MFNSDLGIDLGTANTLVYLKGKGIIVNEPSVVAVDMNTKKILAVGNEAKEMIGRTPGNIRAIRPMKDGVIADFDITQNMLKYFINKAKKITKTALGKPRIVICVPSGVTQVEKRAIIDAAISAGTKEKNAFLIEEPMAAALGAKLPIQSPIGSMIVDIGGGTTEVAVISLGGIVHSESLKVAGDVIDESIVKYIRKEFNLVIGNITAENIKKELGTVFEPDANKIMSITGRNIVTGLPKTINISEEDTVSAIEEPVSAIIEAVKLTLENTKPELSADIMASEITLAGGGALINGLDDLISAITGIKVTVAEEPLNCVANGIGELLNSLDKYKKLLITYKDLRM